MASQQRWSEKIQYPNSKYVNTTIIGDEVKELETWKNIAKYGLVADNGGRNYSLGEKLNLKTITEDEVKELETYEEASQNMAL